MSDGTEVTAAAIARLAGVGRAAVSNWRRRYADFPRPVGGTETSPSFALAEVEGWLREQGKLTELPLRERVWQHIEGAPGGAAPALAAAGEALLALGGAGALDAARTSGSPDASSTSSTSSSPDAPDDPDASGSAGSTGNPGASGGAGATDGTVSVGELARLAREMGADGAYAFLLGRYFDANPRQYTLTPPGTAALMARLAGRADSVLDPACGSGELLAAALDSTGSGAPAVLHGQESDAALARLTALRLTLRAAARARAADAGARGTTVHIRTEDALRTEPADGETPVSAVLCHPPFNERNWGHDELAYDPRWAYGLPARTESELAWVQHALARLRPGGTAVLLLPPAVAARRTGRRVRAALLRKGVLRAVVALPPGAAAPHSLPLHLWVLRQPDGAASAEHRLLVMDTGVRWQAEGREPLPWRELGDTVLAAWHAHDAGREVPEEPGVCGTLAAIDLLDDDVDLTPARHLLPGGGRGDAEALAAVRADLERTLRGTLELAGASAAGEHAGTPGRPEAASWPEATVGELARGGALEVHTAGTENVTTAPGDVIVPVQGRGAAYVVAPGDGGEALPKPLCLLRPDPEALDPWFVAGFLRSTANTRQASSYASSASRIDVRRLRLPRLPLERQRRYGEHFRGLATFESGLRRVGELGEEFVQGMFDGLADGTLPP